MQGKKEAGSLIVEASIVFPVMFLVIFFMIYAGNAFLQKSRVESIVNACAIDGSAYCADPQLKLVEANSLPTVKNVEIYPYRFFSSNAVGDVGGQIEGMIRSRISGMSSGLFSGMKPRDVTVQTSYVNGIIYATFQANVSYKIEIPIRLLGEKENISVKVTTHVEMPVSNSAEFMRNVDMVGDYMDRYGVTQKIEEMVAEAKKWFTK